METERKVVLVTGGAQGIGKGIVHHLLQKGYRVVLADRDTEAGQETENEYKTLGDVSFVAADVSDEESVRKAVQYTIETFSGLHGLVNNAGIASPGNAPVEELELEHWNRIITTNLTGYFLCAKHCVPFLRKSRGAMVNIASTRALQSEPHTEAYSASKGGVVALTHALAMSLGPQVRVNCISPGWIVVSDWKKQSDRAEPQLRPIDHEQHPAGRAGNPQDIASLTAYLLSDESSFITGQNFVVDGGMTKRMIYVE